MFKYRMQELLSRDHYFMFSYAHELYYNLVAAETVPYIGDSNYLGGFMIEGAADHHVQ